MHTLTEQEVADRLGVSLREVQELRKDNLFEKEHFVRRGRMVELLETGLQEIKNLLGMAKKNAPQMPQDGLRGCEDAAKQKKTAPAPVPTQGAALVKMVTRNPHLILAEKDGREIRVRVKDNRNFVPHMAISVQDGGGVWYLVGRCPRWKGRF